MECDKQWKTERKAKQDLLLDVFDSHYSRNSIMDVLPLRCETMGSFMSERRVLEQVIPRRKERKIKKVKLPLHNQSCCLFYSAR